MAESALPLGVSVMMWRYIILLHLQVVCASSCLLIKLNSGGGSLLINISNGTIIILCLHRIMISLAYHVNLDAYLGSLVIVVLCYPLILFFNKYLPWFVGKFSK